MSINHVDGQVQSRMAAAGINVYEFDNMGKSHHIYKTVQTPLIDEAL